MSDQDGSVQKILHEQVERVNKPQMALSSKQLEKLAQDLRLPYGVNAAENGNETHTGRMYMRAQRILCMQKQMP